MSPLRQIIRSMLLCAMNYQRLFGVVTASLMVLLGVLVYLHTAPAWIILVTLLASIHLALFFTSREFLFFSERAKKILSDSEAAQLSIEHRTQGTGLAPLDEITNLAIGRIRTLEASVESIGNEADILIERYQVLTENLAASVSIRDAVGKIAYCSPYTEVLTGYPVDDIYSRKEDFFLAITHPDDKEIYERALGVAQTGEAFQFRYRFFHRSGLEMWAETRTVPILADDGTVLSSLSITLDVTGTVRYQKQVEEKNRDLEDFAYMVSHDLKAPIYTIKGMLNLIEQDLGENIPKDIAEPLSHIQRSTRRLESLVHGVLEYAKISNSQAQSMPVNLQELFDEILTDFAPQLSSCAAIVNRANDLPTVLGDTVQAYQIFSNLVGNAIKYRVSERPLELSIRTVSPESDNLVIIEVSDNGRGIPESMLETIFRPFQRVDADDDASTDGPSGSGIGLASARKLAERHGGTITAQNNSPHGSSFRVTLQRAS